MKILVIGSGGREHALVWKFAQSSKVERVFCAPGNPGVAGVKKAECVGVKISPEDGFAAVREFVRAEGSALATGSRRRRSAARSSLSKSRGARARRMCQST